MVYNYVSGRVAVAMLYNDLGVNSSGWEANAPRWIMNALSKLGSIKNLEKTTETIKIVDNLGELPFHMRRIDAIFYENEPVTILHFNGRIKNRPIDGQHVCQIINGQIEFDLPIAELTINYRKLPVAYDDELNVYFPLIPDLIEVQIYVTYYLLYNIMILGFKHPVFSFDSRNPDTNITKVLAIYEKQARSKISRISNAERIEIAKIMGNFLTDYDTYSHHDINYPKLTSS